MSNIFYVIGVVVVGLFVLGYVSSSAMSQIRTST